MESNHYIYYVILSFTVFTAIFFKRLGFEQCKRIFMYVNFLMLIIISGIRSNNVGADTLTYYSSFSYLSDMQIHGWYVDSYEWGYVLLNKVAYAIWPTGQSIILISAFVSLTLMGYFIYRASEDVYVSVISFVGLYIFFQSFTFVRQFIAVGIYCVAIIYLARNRRIAYIIITIFASAFHAPIALLTLVVLVVPLNIKKTLLSIGGIICLTILFQLDGLSLLIDVFPDGDIKYLSYIGSNHDIQNVIGAALIRAVYCWIIGSMALFYIFKRKRILLKNHKKVDKDRLNEICALLTLINGFVILMGYSSQILGRFELYLFFFSCISLPYVLSNITRYCKTIICWVLFLLYYLYVYRMINLTDNPAWVDYDIFFYR